MVEKIILESPFSNSDQRKFNDNYFYLCVCARKMMLDKNREVSPLFFHALYTQFLHDDVESERNLGLVRSFEYHSDASSKVYAIDRGITKGMVLGAEDALKKGIDIKLYTVHDPESNVGKAVSIINKVNDPAERWKMACSYVDSLKLMRKNKESYDETGDLTLYSDLIVDDLKEVKKCILDFFSPLVDSIRLEEKETLKKTLKNEGTKVKNKYQIN